MRPLYAIAHRCNNPDRVADELKRGANAVECDLRLYRGRFWVQHDPIRDSTNVATLGYWLDETRKLADKYKDQFALVIFDVKQADAGTLNAMYSMVEEQLSSPTGLYVIWSVGDYENLSWFDRIVPRLTSKTGLAVDYDTDPRKASKYFEARGVENICYANGISDWLPDLAGSIATTVRHAVTMKRHEGIIKFVYVWTIDLRASMKDYLDMGVDGIMTNDVDDLMAVLHQPPYKHRLRLATRDDSPFVVAQGPGYLGNQRSKEVHDLATVKNQCQIGRIKRPQRFDSWAEAKAAGYDGCWYCMRDYSER